MAALMAVAGWASVASAQEDPNEGDDTRFFIDQSDPRQHAGCSVFHVRGENIPIDHGNFQVFRVTESGEAESHTDYEFWTWSKREPDGEFGWNSRTIVTAEPGVYFANIVVYLNSTEPTVYTTERESIACEGEEGQQFYCATPTAEAREDGAIALDWDRVPNAPEYEVYRATGDGELTILAASESTRYVDEPSVPGTTYRYAVVHDDAPVHASDCPQVEATAIPFFANPVVAALATIGVAGIVFALRRKA